MLVSAPSPRNWAWKFPVEPHRCKLTKPLGSVYLCKVHEEDTAVQAYHVYRHVWKPTIGEKLHAEQDLDNAVEKIKETVGQFTSQVLMNFVVCYCTWWKDKRWNGWLSMSLQTGGGMEIPCRFLYSFSSKVKIYYMKELLVSKVRR